MPSVWSAKDETFYKVGDIGYLATEMSSGKMKVCIEGYLTPEQAIAATLGDVPRLPYFWTHDGTLHIELPRLPESISVRLPDQRDREVGSARTWQYTQGSGTCHYEIAFFGDGKAWFACSECGGMASADYDPPKYCPHCGRKVVDE
jgi:hypothetical protein